MNEADPRASALRHWLTQRAGGRAPALTAITGDAGARRYWRLSWEGGTRIAVDAPPASENNAAFVVLARHLRALGLNAPEIFAVDLAAGFLLIGDLGNLRYLDCLDADNADDLYGAAIAALPRMQRHLPGAELPVYDAAFLRRELGLFEDWLLGRWLGLTPDAALAASLQMTWQLLIDNALAQPQVFMHRDYHSGNLMLTMANYPGILDFQDAVYGPVSYDLVSLLRDCYIDWPAERVHGWVRDYVAQALAAGILRPEHQAQFPRWFDLMGVQRHLKAAGIFARLAVRDGKSGYLRHLPRTLGYVLAMAERYPELQALGGWLRTTVMPRLPGAAG